ncbi:hypothetical protein Cgig2_016694 [Carnegiea gigantea]|uniref:CRM domain-containing protein n=1 Tax=Carnegiea gigantea TaxID=171969 RepID=A0A9Q1QR05_9CARY|nr:hypothetical protein Cgig2_016694 [Carnegiea gigantea]
MQNYRALSTSTRRCQAPVMAFGASPTSLLQNSHTLLNPSNTLSSHFLSPRPRPHFRPLCSRSTSNSETQTPSITIDFEVHQKKKKQRKPKPSFYEQIREKWSLKPVSRTDKFPWQKQEDPQGPQPSLLEASPQKTPHEGREEDCGVFASSGIIGGSEIGEPFAHSDDISGEFLSDSLSDQVSSDSDNGLVCSSFPQENTATNTHFSGIRHSGEEFGGNLAGNLRSTEEVELSGGMLHKNLISSGGFANSLSTVKEAETDNDKHLDNGKFCRDLGNNPGVFKELETISNVEEEIEQVRKVRLISGNGASGIGKLDETETDRDEPSLNLSTQKRAEYRLPWMSENESEGKQRRSNTELAEKMIPEHELKRLRNVALRMKERIKVGAAGVTQALVDTIQETWNIDEVVKLKFEGPSSLNMKRTHEILENKTGGLVIWRSGTSLVLYRGLTYKLGCVKTYAREKGVDVNITEKPILDSMRFPKNLSKEELMEASEFNNVLDELGPRYLDWSGCPPLPVDADLLPPLVPGYKTPFRLLPYGMRHSLRDQETTHFRRLARNTPPHFALGRNRELQGLAAAMVKLWEKSSIAKIAIKRGVLNTNNDRMAEELKVMIQLLCLVYHWKNGIIKFAVAIEFVLQLVKKLTGGTLLSRNKEYIVFYRGNDFLPPDVTKALKEREQLTMLQYQEEEARRLASSMINLNSGNRKVPVVAGTLAETVAATSRWGKQPTREDLEKMLKESAMARRASLMKYLQNKNAIANGKLKKAEKALAKVQECLEPEELPTDLEMITDEERLVFRKMGLSMKPYLLLGRREVFDGTIENMHLHWKFRELVKIIVRGKNFAQVKHIAISLEAESGGVLVSIDKTTKGYAIIIYRGKNYRRPLQLRPRNLLTKRQALARSIELQRREVNASFLYLLLDAT